MYITKETSDETEKWINIFHRIKKLLLTYIFVNIFDRYHVTPKSPRISRKPEEIEKEQLTPGKTRTHVAYNETSSFMYDFLTRLPTYSVMMIQRFHAEPFCRHLFHAVFYVTLKVSQWEKLVVERMRHVILPKRSFLFLSLVDRQMFGNGRVACLSNTCATWEIHLSCSLGSSCRRLDKWMMARAQRASRDISLVSHGQPETVHASFCQVYIQYSKFTVAHTYTQNVVNSHTYKAVNSHKHEV